MSSTDNPGETPVKQEQKRFHGAGEGKKVSQGRHRFTQKKKEIGGRREGTEVRGRRSEGRDRGQRSEDGGRKAEDGKQKTEDR
jgi:hypothetical protein